MLIVIMGVAGSGKTTIGTLLGQQLGIPFFDGDDFHPPENRAKMAAGHPLTDDDRRPWLASINAHLREQERNGASAIVACSALKQQYRVWLAAGLRDLRFVYLRGTPALIAERMRSRQGHFMPPALLDSQFATLEEPRDAVVVEVDASPEEIVERVVVGIELPEQRA